MSSKRCCVPQCVEVEGSYRVLHWFPNPDKDITRFRTWVHAIGGEIMSLSNENIHKLRRVCHAHFEEKYCCRNNKISNIAVPTLFMPGLSPRDSRNPLKENEAPAQGFTRYAATMSIKLCRVCLSTDKPLLELKEKLLDYFQNICDYSSGLSKHLCCSKCKDSLKHNLDFRNKCLKSNKILQNWKSDNSQNKASIHTLQKLLQTYLDDTEEKEKSVDEPICENIPELDYKTSSKRCKNNENNLKNDNGYSPCKIKVEIVKDEVKNDELFEVIDCGTEHDVVNDVAVNDVEVNDVINAKNDVQNNVNHDLNDNNESDDDKFFIDCSGPRKKSKQPKKGVKKSKAKVKKSPNQGKRVYPRKGISEYSQYEAVFDIQLFNTDEDAKRELSQRRVSEPYLSARYRCEMCYTVYKCEKLLQFHMKWHGPGDYVCDICSMCFSANKALYCHKAKCHRGRFACKLCPLITYYGSAMKAHFQKHQGKTFKCHCDRIFNHISSYLSHARLVHASRHVCVTCARTFVSELGLLNHRLRAHQTKSKVDSDATARCEPCALTFANQQVYTVHVLNTDAHKDIAKEMIACPYCGIAFEDAALLKSHKRQNHPKKKDTNDIIKCKLCDAEGAGRTWRRRHYGAAHPHVQYLEEVSEAKLHMCERCGKRFSNICIMKDHMNTHLGVKPYACDRCRATFSSWGSRAAHRERHHAPPARACALCGARFRSASNLAVHMRTHSGVRRHVCTTCGAAFLHRAALREHEQGVHRHVRRVRRKPRSELSS